MAAASIRKRSEWTEILIANLEEIRNIVSWTLYKVRLWWLQIMQAPGFIPSRPIDGVIVGTIEVT